MKKTVCIIVCIAFALALMMLSGCGDESENEPAKETKAKAAQEPAQAEQEAETKAAKKPKYKKYKGVVEARYYESFVLGTDDGSLEFTTNDDTVYYYGDNKYMFVGDVISVKYDEANGVRLAKQIDLLEEPDPGKNLGDFAASLCWSHEEKDKGSYGSGRPTDAYGGLYSILQPERESSISSPQWRAGASCDLFAATAIRGFGVIDFPVTLSDQCAYFFETDAYKDAFEKVETGGDISKMQHGDVGIYIRSGSENNGQGHIFFVDKADGHNWKSNAHYRQGPGYYGVIDDLKDHYSPGSYKYFGVFRLK